MFGRDLLGKDDGLPRRRRDRERRMGPARRLQRRSAHEHRYAVVRSHPVSPWLLQVLVCDNQLHHQRMIASRGKDLSRRTFQHQRYPPPDGRFATLSARWTSTLDCSAYA